VLISLPYALNALGPDEMTGWYMRELNSFRVPCLSSGRVNKGAARDTAAISETAQQQRVQCCSESMINTLVTLFAVYRFGELYAHSSPFLPTADPSNCLRASSTVVFKSSLSLVI